MATHTSTLAFLRLGRRKRAAETPLTAVGAHRPPRLLLKFGIYAGIALVVAAVAGTWLASRNARVRAERDVWADAHYTADQLGRDDLARTALRGPVNGDALAELDVLFGRTALQRGVVRVTLFSRAGIVTYSTDHTLIGQRPYDLRGHPAGADRSGGARRLAAPRRGRRQPHRPPLVRAGLLVLRPELEPERRDRRLPRLRAGREGDPRGDAGPGGHDRRCAAAPLRGAVPDPPLRDPDAPGAQSPAGAPGRGAAGERRAVPADRRDRGRGRRAARRRGRDRLRQPEAGGAAGPPARLGCPAPRSSS